ncbi:MAG: histidinol-phosphate aminotransferase [Chloroflexota bacterium]|jgi:histidinol-phosphate aminotransferase|nr:histidinol-phosphate aminotransferase [Chloroflexota bacterium]
MSNVSIEQFLRPGIASASPYDARHHDFAWRHQELDRLMSNECPLPPSSTVIAAATAALEISNFYPNSGEDLRSAIAAFNGVEPASIILGNGSTEVLDVVTRALVGPGDEVVVSVPTYAFFESQSRLHGAEPLLVPMTDDFRFDVAAIVAAVNERTKIVFLCSPNNPTGNSWTEAELEAVLATGVPTVVDQAYLECGHSPSFASLVARHPNLIVTRTMSKAFGLAALRLGYGIASPVLVDAFLRLRIPFSLSLVALRAGLAAIEHPDELEERRSFISSERERVMAALVTMTGVRPFPSEGNFILIDVKGTGRTSGELVDFAKRESMLLRAMTAHRLKDAFVRVTIGTVEQNDRFIDVFARAIAGGPQRPVPPDTGGAMTRLVATRSSAAVPVGG